MEQFVDLDVLALESNYDPRMQEQSDRPLYLKRRIMGGRGHLSNAQALGAIRQMLDRSAKQTGNLPAHIVLLHRSRQCNCPDLVRRMFAADARIGARGWCWPSNTRGRNGSAPPAGAWRRESNCCWRGGDQRPLPTG